MTKEEAKKALIALKLEFGFGSFNQATKFHKMEDAYNAMREFGYEDDEIDMVIRDLQSVAQKEYDAWKESQKFIDSIFDK